MIRKHHSPIIDRSQPAYNRLVEALEQGILGARKNMSQALEREKTGLFLGMGRRIHEFQQSASFGVKPQDLYDALVKDIQDFFTWMDTCKGSDFENMEKLYRTSLEIEFEPEQGLPFECRKMLASFLRNSKKRPKNR